MDEAAVWNALPAEEHRSVWDETEHKFWQGFEQEQESLRAAAENTYQKATMGVRVDLGMLTGKRSQLAETRQRLSKELALVEEELARVAQACDDKATGLVAMEQEYRKSEHERLEKREQVIKTMESFFRIKRGEDADAGPGPDRRSVREAKALAIAMARPRRDEQQPPPPPPPRKPLPVPETHHTGAPPAAVPAAMAMAPAPAPSSVPDRPAGVLVNVTDADGNVIGPVRRIDPWNQWVKEIQDVPIRRQVKIRRGRKFTQDHLATIYDRSEGKGVKWLSCMIQATGEIQLQRCHSCDKNQGAFDDCIVLGGPLFQKCGNCEWNRQGCHMPLVSKSSNAATPQRGRLPFKKLAEQDLARSGPATPEELGRPAGAAKAETEPAMAHGPPADTKNTKSPILPEPVQMPTPQEPKEAAFVGATHPAAAVHPPAAPGFMAANGFTPANGFAPANGFTPANVRSRPPSREMPTPSAVSPNESPRPTPPVASEPLEEITRENLVLRHNGTVYTHPDIVEGVPLAKIDQNHPYWELGWPCIKSLIEPQLESWRDKNAAALQATARGEGGSAKFQTGRQINRGVRILEFLENGEISPYQLLSKKFTYTGKGAITSYDTLFRLCETLSELAKFNLDVTPVEWLRHRMHEIMTERGASFNVSKTIHDFYHDPKLSALRSKNGFKSIGRPSGYKTGQANSATPQASSKKRKSMHSQASTPRGTPSEAPSPLAVQEAELSPTSAPIEALAPPEMPPAKRPKHLSPALPAAPGEPLGADYSETDSWSGASLARLEWRLYQVKTRLFTSSTQVTQYWTWKEKERLLEHQVLKEMNPVVWGVHRDPIDFSIRLDEVAEVRWNVDGLQVHLIMGSHDSAISKQDGQPRGDVMAAFKRVRTIRRFLSFCQDKKLVTKEVSPEDMDLQWGKMQSERLPDMNEEASEALRE